VLVCEFLQAPVVAVIEDLDPNERVWVAARLMVYLRNAPVYLRNAPVDLGPEDVAVMGSPTYRRSAGPENWPTTLLSTSQQVSS
jgi:hypothetical protein